MIGLFTLLLLVLSVAVLLQQRLLNAVILLGVFSLISSVVYFLAGAPDVAVTEGAIGVAFVTFIYVLALSDQGKLHVVAEEVRPFLFQERGEVKGLEYEILSGFAEEVNLELEVEFVGHPELTSLIGGRRADLIAGAYFSGYLDREDLVNTTTYSRGNLAKIRTPEAGEEEVEIGLLRDFSEELVSGETEEKLARFDSMSEMIDAYSRGRIGGFIVDSGRMSAGLYRLNSPLREKSEVRTLDEVEYGFAGVAREADLLGQLNDYLRELGHSGRLEEIRTRYFGDDYG